MLTHDGTATSPTLLFGVRDWRNSPAWHEFFRRYDALLVLWCRADALDAAAADEIRENVWIELADRMRTFRYDPRKTFRGWLRELCRCRTIDYLRKRQREASRDQTLEDSVISRLVDHSDPPGSDLEEGDAHNPIFQSLLGEVEAVQAAARKRVKPRTWDVFWEIAIADRPIREVAADYGMSYAGAFEAYARTGRILREEGERRNGHLAGSTAGPQRPVNHG